MARNSSSDEDNFTAVNGEDDGFTSVLAPSQIVFNEIGDEWTGRFMGMERLVSGITQANFQLDGEDYFTNAGHDLRKKLEKVPVKALVRMRYTDNLDTGQASPMRIFDVAYK